MKEIQINAYMEKEQIVTDTMLACHVGSGTVSVYATPMMIAFMENTAAACLQQFLDDGETSVGTMIQTTHTAPTPVGMKVCVHAEIIAVDRKKVTFSITAYDEKDCIGKAIHERFIVQKDKFEQKALEKLL